MNWQPIDTAPKDGTHILGWDGCRMFTCKHVAGFYGESPWELVVAGMWASDGDCDPTMWHPLPPDPRG